MRIAFDINDRTIEYLYHLLLAFILGVSCGMGIFGLIQLFIRFG